MREQVSESSILEPAFFIVTDWRVFGVYDAYSLVLFDS